MAMQDISSATGGWTHSDAGATILENQWRIRSVLTDNDTANTYHYKTVDAFTDYIHYFNFAFNTTSGTAQWGIWAVTDTVADLTTLMAYDAANGQVLYLLDTGTVCKLYIGDKDTTTTTRTQYITIDEIYRGRPLFSKVVKSGTSFTCYIYRQQAMTELLYTLSGTLNDGAQSYTKIFMGMNGGTEQHGTISCWSGELHINETPLSIFEEKVTYPLMFPEQYDGFNGFPNSHESWQSVTNITESSAWSSDGDGKSVLLDGGTATAYFVATSTKYSYGIMKATIKITSLSTNAKCPLISFWNSDYSNGIMAYVENVSDTLYFRIAEWYKGAYIYSSSTRMTCELNTEYKITLVSIGRLIVGHQMADWKDCPTAVSKIYLGNYNSISGAGGTRYIDALEYMNGFGWFASVARGGSRDQILLVSFSQQNQHEEVIGNSVRFLYSLDNGNTFKLFHSMHASDHLIDGITPILWCSAIRWCNERQSFFIFLDTYKGYPDVYMRTKLYEITSFNPPEDESPTVTLIRNYPVTDSLYFRAYPTRFNDSEGKCYIGLEYAPYNGPTYNYLESARMNWSDGALSTRKKFAQYGDIPGSLVAEPMLWHLDDGRLAATIRCGSVTATRYRISEDDGATDWYSNSLLDPGKDWTGKGQLLRAFVFRNYTWWLGSDPNSADYVVDWGSFIQKSQLSPIGTDIPSISEAWWFGLGDAGNGEIDASEVGTGRLFLDYVAHIWGLAVYKRLFTGEYKQPPRTGVTNFQNPGIV